ncbi:MAG: alpha-L-arabinofuranosidase C-terminal domain-containing protein, partial [Fimbriimonadaceae bacterium]
SLAPPTITFDPAQGTIKTSRDLYGIFFEEINCAGDGGIYPELVRNRSFEEGLAHWEVSDPSRVKVVEQGVGKHFLEVTLGAPITLTNKGYWGMHFDPNQKYCLTTRTGLEGTVKADVKFFANGKEIGGREWGTLDDSQSLMTKKGTLPSMTAQNASMELTLTGTGKVFFDFISMAPHDKELKPERFRPDLKKLLADLKPRFMRFPGGCWVEGDTMKTAYRWKTTIGDPRDRAHVNNLWGYQSTNGLGYHEYLQLCEDLNAAPMFVVNCGMSHKEVVPMDKMDEFVQDALDAIEYANGPTTSKWGAVRAANGHPESFKLKYLEIGNENGGAAYEERYDLIYKAVKAKYPEVHLIANVWGGTPKKAKLDIIDEHYYSNPSFFIENADRYDTYDRKGPKVYVGEYAVTQGCGNGNLIAAIAEAAFMTGMERNSDHVIMASYAPLLANLNLKSWNPDLIYFDSSRAYGTPSSHVQKMFAENLPDEVFKSAAIGLPSIPTFFPKGGIGVGTWNTQAEFKDIAVYNGKGIRKIAPQDMAQESGVWTVADEVAKQTGNATPTRLFAQVVEASYTVKLKARRLVGAEGFLIT